MEEISPYMVNEDSTFRHGEKPARFFSNMGCLIMFLLHFFSSYCVSMGVLVLAISGILTPYNMFSYKGSSFFLNAQMQKKKSSCKITDFL